MFSAGTDSVLGELHIVWEQLWVRSGLSAGKSAINMGQTLLHRLQQISKSRLSPDLEYEGKHPDVIQSMSNPPSSGILDKNTQVKKEVRKLHGKHKKCTASYVDFGFFSFLSSTIHPMCYCASMCTQCMGKCAGSKVTRCMVLLHALKGETTIVRVMQARDVRNHISVGVKRVYLHELFIDHLHYVSCSSYVTLHCIVLSS
jgi:hypothetical protein